jgi:hypothetical protein
VSRNQLTSAGFEDGGRGMWANEHGWSLEARCNPQLINQQENNKQPRGAGK